MTRCEHCASPAVERDGRVLVPHLTWCPRAPRGHRAAVADDAAMKSLNELETSP